MCLTIAIGTMLLGGWVLDLPAEDDKNSTAPQQQQQSQQQQSQQQQSQQQAPSPALMPPREQGRPAANMASPQGRTQMDAAGGMRSQQRQSQAFIPSAPTESLPSDAMTNQPTAPTSNYSNPTLGQRAPMAPTERRSLSDGGGFRPSSFSGQGSPFSAPRPAQSGTAAYMVPPSAAVSQATTSQEKAFAGYRAPSGVSPYMNLFRRDSGGTVDNYSTLVRPESDQRFLNQRFGSDIRGLQNSTRTQGINLQNLNQQNRTLQGVGTPQYYMNYGNYYPGYGQ
ncbi:MAG: hypothetical protein ABFC54_06535 [Thermoguttaceae bacterium]